MWTPCGVCVLQAVVAQTVLAEGATAPFERAKNLLQLQPELQRIGRIPQTIRHHRTEPSGHMCADGNTRCNGSSDIADPDLLLWSLSLQTLQEVWWSM